MTYIALWDGLYMGHGETPAGALAVALAAGADGAELEVGRASDAVQETLQRGSALGELDLVDGLVVFP